MVADIEPIEKDHPGWMDAMRLALRIGAQPIADVDRAIASLREAVKIQKLTVDAVFGATENGRLTAACVGVVSPGRSVLTFLGPTGDDGVRPNVGVPLLAALQAHAWRRDIVLLQALLPTTDGLAARLYRDAGFGYLTELVYRDRPVRASKPPPQHSPHVAYLTYSRERESLFLDALEGTYVKSLDCPGLAGIRAPRDILLGHLHTGVADPENLWYVALRHGRPLGVLLLSGVHHRSCLEVVYMGVVDQARGQRLGDALLGLAVDVGRRRGVENLTLAVDHTNTHACHLYDRWGFRETARRRAWICRRPF